MGNKKIRSHENLHSSKVSKQSSGKKLYRQKTVSTSQDFLHSSRHISGSKDWRIDSPGGSSASNSDVSDLESESDNEYVTNNQFNRQGQLERSNSLTLEQKEKEAKDRILNIFSMRSKIQKWKNNTNESANVEKKEPSYKNCAPTGEKLSDRDLQFCLRKTRFSKKTILFWFKSFRTECPNGKLSRTHLYELFTKIFPSGNAESFCDHIFRIFDSDGNNFLDFKEFLMALDIAQCTDERQKLEWSFRMWDVDDSGSINVTEMTNIIATMDDVEGEEQEPKPGQLFSRLSARMRAKEIFDKLDVDGDGEITKTEFVEGYLMLMK